MTDIVDRLNDSLSAGYSELRKEAAAEITRLRAKITEMERQEPYSYIYRYADPLDGSPIWRHDSRAWNGQIPGACKPLYALPGAQPAPIIPEGWKLVPTAESRHPAIYRMLAALHIADKTAGLSEWDSYRAMLAAAPEAKPCP